MKNKTFWILSMFFVLLSYFIFSCKKNRQKDNENCVGMISFAANVSPIIQNHCLNSGCHGFDNGNTFQLLTHQQVDSAVIFHNLLPSIKHQTPFPMPRIDPLVPDAIKLPDSVIAVVECWVNQGRQNN
jgi:hypothetical protein